ncbi:hypothetical protein ESCO_003856 [Escovopsis weberi]|uniref:Uncharacterized protein n=1 Tax=Escovopsis weberi TaxID=150374 RepID=A0A0M9VX38_ESCWE|nr:hypothetical protein ESCO_003856 [Escovopsis weberi]
MPPADFDGTLPQPGIRHGSSGVVIFEVLRERVWPLLSIERRRLVTEQLHLARVTTHMKHVSTHTLDRKALRDGGIACFILLHTIWGRSICQTRRWWSQYVEEAPELAEALPWGRIPLPEFEDRPDRTVHRARAAANTSSGEGAAGTEAQLYPDRAATPNPQPNSGSAYPPGAAFAAPTDPALGNGAFDVLLQTAQVASDEQYVRSLISEHIASLQNERHYLLLSAEEYLRRMDMIAGDMADNSRITHSFVNLQRASMANFHQGVNASLDVLESKIRSLERSLGSLDNRR